jgi:hypothetical protein
LKYSINRKNWNITAIILLGSLQMQCKKMIVSVSRHVLILYLNTLQKIRRDKKALSQIHWHRVGTTYKFMLNPNKFTDTFLGNYNKLKLRSPYDKTISARCLCMNGPRTEQYSFASWCLFGRQLMSGRGPGNVRPGAFKIGRCFWRTWVRFER